EQDREPEHNPGASAGGFFLQRGPRPLEAVARRQGACGDAFHRGERLSGAIPGFLRAIDDGATECVVAHHRLWSLYQLRLGDGADGYHSALRVAHVYPIDIVDVIAKRGLRLNIDLPRATKHVEVIDVVASERRLQGIEDIGDLNPKHLDLVAIDLKID